jgi:hypothetical protein
VLSGEAYAFDRGGGFIPSRKDVDYLPGTRAERIRQLLPELHLVQQHPRWGLLARRGHFEIDTHDLLLIARAMGYKLRPARAA